MVTFEILKHIGIISNNGWDREVNIVSWNGGAPKVDIREWSEDHTKTSKGITMTENEAEQLCMILHNYIAERSVK